MKRVKDEQSWQYNIVKSDEGGIVLHIKGLMDASTAANMIRELTPPLKDHASPSLTVDLSGVTSLDDFGVLVLVELKKSASSHGASFQLKNTGDGAREMLSITGFDSLAWEGPSFSGKRRSGMFVRLSLFSSVKIC